MPASRTHVSITRRSLSLLISLGLLFMLTFNLLSSVKPTRAAAYVVNTTSDVTNGSCTTMCSLRDAMTLAPSGSTITFSVSGPIALTSLLPTVNTSLIIDGSGQVVTLTGGGTVQIMYVSATGNLSVNALTFANGYTSAGQGGAIQNAGTLNVLGSTFRNNSAAQGTALANMNGGIVNVANSTFTTNGSNGAIANSAVLNVTNSTMLGNGPPPRNFSVQFGC